MTSVVVVVFLVFFGFFVATYKCHATTAPLWYDLFGVWFWSSFAMSEIQLVNWFAMLLFVWFIVVWLVGIVKKRKQLSSRIISVCRFWNCGWKNKIYIKFETVMKVIAYQNRIKTLLHKAYHHKSFLLWKLAFINFLWRVFVQSWNFYEFCRGYESVNLSESKKSFTATKTYYHKSTLL